MTGTAAGDSGGDGRRYHNCRDDITWDFPLGMIGGTFVRSRMSIHSSVTLKMLYRDFESIEG